MLAGISVNQNLCEGKIAMSAYSDLYLSDAMRNLGGMLDYAVNDCSISMRTFLEMFILSGKAELFECGNPSLISGMSGEELAIFVIQKSGLTCEMPPSVFRPERSAEYWCGWILAYLQWETGWPFRWICNGCPAEDLLSLYPVLHETSEQKAASVLRGRIERSQRQTQLQRLRSYANLTQSALAKKADVSLRSIQMYEQQRKDINKAQAVTLQRLANALGCRERDLMEYR
jgi:DNA-binding XRE family transcriptional regulator